MKRARKMAQRADWKEAAQIWEKLSTHPEAKVAKRALYNRAVAAEFMGNYEDALMWARKAADTYGFNAADAYIYTLKNRLAELDRLDQQMK
jgi:outer membrane protein assembly factor BamD (BamD/ComL family)